MRIANFVVRRSFAAVFTVVAMITLAFIIFWLIPSQPQRFIYPNAPYLTNYQVKTANHLLGIDKPKLNQYFHYLGRELRFDFGNAWGGSSIRPNQTLDPGYPIAQTVYPSLRVTLSLILGGAFFVLLLAVPLGTLAGSRVGSIPDRVISLVALIGICMHPMVLGLILRSAFGHHLHWTPQTGYCPLFGSQVSPGATGGSGPPVAGSIAQGTVSSVPTCGGLADWASHLALPWFTFALLFLALYIRMVRASVADTLHEDFVRTARAKGASERRVLSRHVLPNASLKLLTMIGMEIGTAIGVCIYIEVAYGLHGLADEAVFALSGQTQLDLPLVLAIVLLITLIVVIGNLIVDVLYAVLDPRAGRGPAQQRTKSLAGGVI
jgi:peptide/nickel transport system permease protein